MKVERNIVAPFCIFGIVMGVGGKIILPLANVFFEFSKGVYTRFFYIAWIAGAIFAFFYSTIVLKYFLKGSFTEIIMYCFLASVFIGLIIFPFFR